MRIAKPFAAGALVCLVACGGGGGGSGGGGGGASGGGGGGASGGGGGGTPPGAKFLYASVDGGPNLNPGYIYGFAVDPGGALTEVPGPPVGTGDGGPPPIAITRDSKFLYAGSHVTPPPADQLLLASQINADGSLTSAPVPSYSVSDTPSGLVAHPTADFLYVSGNSGVLTVFAIDSATGALSPTSSVNLGKFLKSSAVITPNGRYLYQNDLDRNDDLFPASLQIAGFSIDAATGALSPVPGSPLTLTTPSPSTTSGIGPMAIDPTAKFLYVAYQFYGPDPDGRVAAYSIDAASGALTAVPESPFDVGGVPYSLAIDASGRFLIAGIFPRPGAPQRNCGAVLSIDTGTGALTSVPGSPFGPTQLCGFIAADPSGPYVYTGSSRPDPGAVSMFSINQTTGELALIGEATVPGAVNATVDVIALTH